MDEISFFLLIVIMCNY